MFNCYSFTNITKKQKSFTNKNVALVKEIIGYEINVLFK